MDLKEKKFYDSFFDMYEQIIDKVKDDTLPWPIFEQLLWKLEEIKIARDNLRLNKGRRL